MLQSLRWRMILSFILLISLSLGALILFLPNFIRVTYQNAWISHFLSDARLLADQVAPLLSGENAPPELQDKIDHYSSLVEAQVQVIAPSGEVLAGSITDIESPEGYLANPEIQQALNHQEDYQIRFSQQLKMEVLYVAAPVYTGDQVVAILQLAAPLSMVHENMAPIYEALILAVLLIFAAMVITVILLTHYTTRPLRELTAAVLKINDGEKVEIPSSIRQDEIGQLNNAFSQMANQLNAQISALSAERGTLAAVLAHMTDGILIVDAGGIVRLINPAAQLMFKVSESEALDNSLIEATRSHQLAELWQKCRRTATQQTTTLETSPERLFIQAIATPLYESMPGSILLVFQDLTRLRRLEMVRRDFVSNVSHELRTPLASLKALSETLSEGALDDPPAARRFLSRMDSEIDNLTQMVQELLELSRIESGRVPLERGEILPHELVDPAIDRMRLQAERAGLSLHLDCPLDLPAIYADQQRMQQVLVNLLHNAIKFTPPGGEIHVSAYAKENKVVFAVKDTGVGIEQEYLSRIFERFYKADRARSGGGTGLGLSIARHLVESHGGRIWAESQPGQGSTFFFSLPTY